jgi:hypothetical protein
MICSRCKVDKPTSDFHKRYDGFQPACKMCKSDYQKDSRNKDKIGFNKKKQIHLEKRRDVARTFVADYLTKHPCIDCGEADIVVLDFDHRSEKEFNVSVLVCSGSRIERIETEIAKCDVRCANCHRRKTAKDFKWWRSRSVS